MEDSICRKYLEIARKKRVKYIYGYASSIYILASCHPTRSELKKERRWLLMLDG